MYCPVYGCKSDFKKNMSSLHFFRFPNGNSGAQQKRRKAWIEFCKRKAFEPLANSRICSLHFAEDAYEAGHSPQFLERLECKEAFRIPLKSDAVPTLNKALPETSSSKTRTHAEKRRREKVIIILVSERIIHVIYVSTKS